MLDLGEAQSGRVATRNAGTNPDLLRGGPAAVGSKAAVRADLCATAYTSAELYAFPSPARLALGAGPVLLGTSNADGGALRIGREVGPVATFAFFVPPLPVLAGAEIVLQAVLRGGGGFALTKPST